MIYKGNQEAIPLSIYSNLPYVGSVYDGDKGLMFPDWNSICTYGYNLTTSDYRGRVPQDLRTMFYDNGQVKSSRAYTSTSSDSSKCATHLYARNGVRAITVVPTFSSLNNAKEKIRGINYSAWDPKLGIEIYANGSSGYASPFNSEDGYLYGYLIEDKNIKIKNGWFIAYIDAPVNSSFTYSVPCFYKTATSSRVWWENKGYGSLGIAGDAGTEGYITLNSITKIINVNGREYIFVKINETSLEIPDDCVSVVISPINLFIITTSSDTIRAEITSFGMTFGTT